MVKWIRRTVAINYVLAVKFQPAWWNLGWIFWKFKFDIRGSSFQCNFWVSKGQVLFQIFLCCVVRTSSGAVVDRKKAKVDQKCQRFFFQILVTQSTRSQMIPRVRRSGQNSWRYSSPNVDNFRWNFVQFRLLNKFGFWNRSPAFQNQLNKTFLCAFSGFCPDLIVSSEKTEQENLGSEIAKKNLAKISTDAVQNKIEQKNIGSEIAKKIWTF